ncbi:hypothetical protein [Psychromonas ossibalaenae]|uniref:hypothetical protein n=1 Tax=Psychromonas ossibalaenae TaxID=444922 RepID=UPI00036370DB|nr:hypothetical protein [Psychromonas ossibalaenae]
MQELNINKKNCQRFSIQADQAGNCKQKPKRIRYCGRVSRKQEMDIECAEKAQGHGQRMAGGQGKRMANRQGKRMAAGQCQRRSMA